MHGFSVVEMWQSMGLLSKGITIFMLLMAVYMVAIIIERGLRFYKGSQQSFDYVVTDGTDTDTGTVTVTVASGNHAPVANNDTASTSSVAW